MLSSEVCYFIICLLYLHYTRSLPVTYVTLCSMLWHAYYASNYAGIIGAGLISGASTVSVSIQTDLQLSIFSSKNDVAVQTEDSAIQYKGKEGLCRQKY